MGGGHVGRPRHFTNHAAGIDNFSEWVRRTLNNEVAGRDVDRMTDRLADRVLHGLLHEIERVLLERAAGASPTPQWEWETPVPYVPGPKQWDPSCDDADLHERGKVCASCGGSAEYVVR